MATETDTDERLKQWGESEGDARAIVDGIPGFVAILGTDGTVQVVNRRILDYCGQPLEQLRHWGTNGTVHPEDMPHVAEVFGGSMLAGTPYYIEQRLRRFDGTYRWFGNSGIPAKDDAGRILHWYVLLTDVDERRKAEEALRAREVDLRLIIDTIPGLICLFAPDGQLEGANRQFLDYLQQTFEEARHWATNGNVHAEDLPGALQVFSQSVATGEPYDMECRVRRFDGVFRWFHIRGQAHRDADGRVVRWYGLLIDIDDRKRAERALEVSERNLRLTVDTIPALAWSANADGTADFFNQHYLDYVGLSQQQVRDWQWIGVLHPEDLATIQQAWESFRVAGVGGEVEARIRRHDGVYRWFLFRANPLRDEQGNIVKWFGVNADIEDRKRAELERLQTERELRRREYLLATGERVSLTGSFAWQANPHRITSSEQLLRILEFSDSSEVTVEAIRARIHPDDLALLETTVADVAGGQGDPDFEIRLLVPDGRIKYVRVSLQVVSGADGQLEYIGAVQDVTRRRLAEDALDKVRSDLMHLTRSMSLGTLTASIAHEVNQPLAGIVTNASTCVRMLSADPPNVSGALEVSRRNIRDGKRAAEVIARLRALFARNTTRSAEIDLNEATAEVVTLLASDLQRNRVLVQTDLAPNLPRLTADRVQLQQVLLNLLRNASDAVAQVHDRPRSIVIRTTRDGDDHVRLTVQDNGVGFAPEHAEAMFQAFYTTKSAGMGIGLSVSRTIIESHQGRLWAECDADGATFAFRIPVTLPPATA